MVDLTRYFSASAVVVVALLPAACNRPGAERALISTEQPHAGTDGAFSKETFTYKTVGKTTVKADVYRLAGEDLRPAIMWIHGGALIFGNRGMLPDDERDRFLRAGFVVVAIDYRLAPETKLPEILNDVEDAHRWIRVKGPALFRVDADRVVAIGQSAGAYLALMAGARARPRLRAVVSFYGYGDISGEWYSRPDAFYLSEPRISEDDAFRVVGGQMLSESPPSPRSDFYVYCRQNGRWPNEVAGLDPDTESAKFEIYTPEALVTSAYPPTLLLHGDRDTDVPFQMSERMSAVLTRHRIEHRLLRMEGFNHMFDVFPDGFPPAGPPTGLQNPRVAEAFEVVLSFLAKHVSP